MDYITIKVFYSGLIVKNIFEYLRSRDYHFTEETKYFVISFVSITTFVLNIRQYVPFISLATSILSGISISLHSCVLLYFLEFPLIYTLSLCFSFIIMVRLNELLVIGYCPLYNDYISARLVPIDLSF